MEHRNDQPLSTFRANEINFTTWALSDGAIARLGRGLVNDIAFSPDMQYLAVATYIGIWIYALPKLTPIALWDTENGHSESVSFSPDSRWLASYSENEETIKVWDVNSGVCIAHMEDSYQPDGSKPIFTTDSQYLFNRTFQWCTETGEIHNETDLWHPHPNNAATHFTLSSDGSLVIGERFNHQNDHTAVVVWDVKTGEQIAVLSENSEDHTLFWWNPCFSPCMHFLAASDAENKISVWELQNGTLVNTYTDFKDAMLYPYYLQNGDLITAAILPQKVEIWNAEKNEIIDQFKINNKYINRHIVRFSDDGTQLAVSVPNELTLWTKGKKNCHSLLRLNGHTDTADSLAFSAGGKTLAAGYWDSNVILWDIARQRAIRPNGEELQGTAHAVYLSANGRFIATGGDDKDVLWISEIEKPQPVAELTEEWIGVRQPRAYSHDLNRLACAAEYFNIHIWEYKTLEDGDKNTGSWDKHSTLTGHSSYIRGMAFSPDGKKLVSISAGMSGQESRDARLWDIDTDMQIAELALPTFKNPAKIYREWDVGITFSPCGDLIAGGQCGEIILWSAIDGETVMTIPQPKDSQRPITLRFSPCGNYLASGAWWQPGLKLVSIRLWEIASQKNIATFWGHTTDVQDLQFSPDGSILASAGHDGVIYLWDLKPYLQEVGKD
ncbi:hypothetical protein F4X73_07500 [Candidatus Poribacteria bacterium]|nr:hypothetical protein [Candidatus Poribacteria bacterium]MYB64521.1 hypothetical protein [Candidatus Poribacteria bacterium]